MMGRSETAAEQLQVGLNSRVAIEQAKGKIAERYSLDMDQAFGCCATTPATRTSGSPAWPATSSAAPPRTSRRQPAVSPSRRPRLTRVPCRAALSRAQIRVWRRSLRGG
jgi:ANTAR domain